MCSKPAHGSVEKAGSKRQIHKHAVKEPRPPDFQDKAAFAKQLCMEFLVDGEFNALLSISFRTKYLSVDRFIIHVYAARRSKWPYGSRPILGSIDVD